MFSIDQIFNQMALEHKLECPLTGNSEHYCSTCNKLFTCESAITGAHECIHFNWEDDDDLECCCSKRCAWIEGDHLFLDDDDDHDVDDFKRRAQVNRKKLCTCDILMCCNDEEGCWSPRDFDLLE